MSDFAALAAEFSRRQIRRSFDPEKLCFPKQLAAVVSCARSKVLKCGRRSGKTRAIMLAKLLKAAREGKRCLYITLTRANAKEILWDDLLALNEQYQLGGIPNISELTLNFPNHGVIALRGVNNARELGKIRGKRWDLAVIDEAQSIPDSILEPLMKSDLGPTLMDLGGSRWLVGTPPPVQAGYFFECYAGKYKHLWEQHRWTVIDNTELPVRKEQGRSIEDILSEIREENRWTEADTTYRREYLGEDIEDAESLLFQFNPKRNVVPMPIGGQWRYVIGCDVGYDDADAIAVLGWQVGIPLLYLVHEDIGREQDVFDLAARLTPIIQQYNPLTIAVDQGGGAKKSVATLQRRFGIPLTPADKNAKPDHIKLLNAELRKGRLVAKPGTRWEEDCQKVQRDPKALLKGKLEELPKGRGGFHSDICDAVLYGWRAALHWAEQPAKPEPTREEKELADFIKKQQQRGGGLSDAAKEWGY